MKQQTGIGIPNQRSGMPIRAIENLKPNRNTANEFKPEITFLRKGTDQ